jgi:hypothetical protein
MTNKDEALKMAIEVMEGRCAWGKAKSEVIEMCKEALEQKEPHKPEHGAWFYEN